MTRTASTPASRRSDYRAPRLGRDVAHGLEALQAANVDVNVLCTVHAANQDDPLDLYRLFRDDLGLRFMQLIPIVETDNRTATPVASDASGYRREDRATRA